MNNSVVLKASDFKYPSKEERAIALKNYPKLSSFKFHYQSELVSVLSEGKSLKEASNESNLYWWSNCLSNRLGKLKESYVYLATCYNRGFSDNNQQYTPSEAVNKFMFDYYSEIFYYFFFSTRDTIAQIIRIYFSIGSSEHFYLKNIIENVKGKNSMVGDSLDAFIVATKGASDIRNAFTHRFPPTEIDNRSVITESNGSITLAVNSGDFTKSIDIFTNINTSLKSLETLLKTLLLELK